MSNFDVEKFRKVHELMKRGATAGERAAAKDRAEAIARAAGLTLQQAVSKMDEKAAPQSTNFFAGFDDWMEEKEPGYKKRRAAERAERDRLDDIRRSEVLEEYGSEDRLFERTEWERLLDEAIAPLATWDYWTHDETGKRHRFAKTICGRSPHEFHYDIDRCPGRLMSVVMHAYPMPPTVMGALTEYLAWRKLGCDRDLFSGGEWNHYSEVTVRIMLLESILEEGDPASIEDIEARIAYQRIRAESWYDAAAGRAFVDRMSKDIGWMKAATSNGKRPMSDGADQHAAESGEQVDDAVQFGRRTNADKQEAIMSILDKEPNLSARQLGKRAGVSPQTALKWKNLRTRIQRIDKTIRAGA